MTGRVFVVQRPAYFDRLRKGWVNKYDLSPAREHGELEFLLRPGNIYRDKLVGARDHLRKELVDYCDQDCLLAVGDPVAIAMAVLIAGEVNDGRVRILKYDRIVGKYDAYEIEVGNNDG